MPSCILCGSQEFKLLHHGHDRMFHTPGQFAVIECINCGVVLTDPALASDEIGAYYRENYLLYSKPISEEKNSLKRFDRQNGVNLRCNAILKHWNGLPGKVLDIGCATGVFLQGMQARGWAAYGVETSAYAASIAKEYYGVDVFVGELGSAKFPDSFFEIVTLWDVIEHLSEPLQALQMIHRILKPSGVLVITTPNSHSWSRKIFKKYWAGWETPRHYAIFNEKLINEVLEKQSFEPISYRSFTGNLGADLLSVDFWLGDKKEYRMGKKVISKLAHSIFFRLITYPYYWLLRLLKKGSSMTIIARKGS